jgi:hypothetical protein
MKTGLTFEYQKLKPYLPETIASVLDVGCGDGSMDMGFPLPSRDLPRQGSKNTSPPDA